MTMALLINPQTIPPGGKPPWHKFLLRSEWKFRPTATRKTPPTTPPTPDQIGIRACISYAFRVWWTLAAWEHATYANGQSKTYLQVQMDRWAANHGPTRTCPGSNDVGPDAIDEDNYVAGRGQCLCRVKPASATQLAAVIIFRSAQEITVPGRHNALVFIATASTDWITWLDSPLAPGTYHYRSATLDRAGRIGPPDVDAEVTVT